MTSIACAIISTAHRWPLVRDQILPQVLQERFDEVVVAGDGESGTGYRHLNIPPITGTTVDALIKRDAASAATDSEYVFYLSDDHRPHVGALQALRAFVENHAVEVLIPARTTWRETEDGLLVTQYNLNSGAADGYCAGHAGVYYREILRMYPWTTAPHDRYWDLLHSQRLRSMGVEFHYAVDVAVEDVEHLLNPAVTPWL